MLPREQASRSAARAAARTGPRAVCRGAEVQPMRRRGGSRLGKGMEVTCCGRRRTPLLRPPASRGRTPVGECARLRYAAGMKTRFHDRHDRLDYLKACEEARRILVDASLLDDARR